MGLNKCIKTCIHHYGIIENSLTALKILCALSIHPSTLSLEAIKSGRAPKKWWFWQINFREWKDQGTMKRGGCPGHRPSQQSRQEMVNSIGIACLFCKDILNCAHFSLLIFFISSPLLHSKDSHLEAHLNIHTLSDSLLYNSALISTDENRNHRCARRHYPDDAA